MTSETQQTLTRKDLFSLEQYAEIRNEFRGKVIEHKKNRRVAIGENLALYFEDRLTIQYQVQEMLRIEKIFEADAILEELEAYNPLIPTGSNLKCTAMLEFGDPAIRRERLAQLVGIEHLIWAQVDGFDRVFAISNEDLERSTDEKTSAVHFMRFEFTGEMKSALAEGAALSFGSSHDGYPHEVTVSDAIHQALIADLN